MAIIRIFGLSLICTFFVACWYAPYWMHGMISYLPMDGLFLYTQTEYYTMKTICWLTFITSFPYRWYLHIRYFNMRFTLIWYTYIYRLVIWFRCMCLGLWRRELTRDVAFERDLWYVTYPISVVPASMYMELSPSRLERVVLGCVLCTVGLMYILPMRQCRQKRMIGVALLFLSPFVFVTYVLGMVLTLFHTKQMNDSVHQS